jgi:hypothetical protein
LVGVLIPMEPNIGLDVTPGEHTGVKVDSSKSKCTKII